MSYYIASVSWARDSTAMLLRILEEKLPLDEVVFFNNGMDFNAIYNVRDDMLGKLKVRGVKYTELKPKNHFMYDMLLRPVESEQKGKHEGYGWCGGLCRWGTTEKIAALNRYAKEKKAKVYVGIAADEAHRLKSLEPWKITPLVHRWNMTEADCLEFCSSKYSYCWWENAGAGYVKLYDVLDRVSCWCCCNKNLKELKNIYRYLPDYWERLRCLQIQLDRPMKGFYKGQPRGIFELEARFAAEITKEAEKCEI